MHRLIFRHEAWMTMFADKYRVRDYVSNRAGAKLLPELYFVTVRPESIPFGSLPQRFVVKPTHGSGWVQPVRDGSRLDRDALVRTCPTPGSLRSSVRCVAIAVVDAGALADNINFIRIDFYDTGDKLFFGELTVTPGGRSRQLRAAIVRPPAGCIMEEPREDPYSRPAAQAEAALLAGSLIVSRAKQRETCTGL